MPKTINITNNYYGEVEDPEQRAYIDSLEGDLVYLTGELAAVREERDAAAEEAEQNLSRAMAAEQELVEANEQVNKLTEEPAKPGLGSLWTLSDVDGAPWIYIGMGEYLQSDWYLGWSRSEGVKKEPLGDFFLFDDRKHKLIPHTP